MSKINIIKKDHVNPIKALKYSENVSESKVKLSRKQKQIQNKQVCLGDFISKENMKILTKSKEEEVIEAKNPRLIEVELIYKLPSKEDKKQRIPSKKLTKHKKEVYKERYRKKQAIVSNFISEEKPVVSSSLANYGQDISLLEGKDFNDFIKGHEGLKRIRFEDVNKIMNKNQSIDFFRQFEGVNSISKGKIVREYVDMDLSEEIDTKLGQFLVKLRDIYFRKVESAPLKAKRRFVCGMNEVKKQIELGYAKLVIFVPDIEKVSGKEGLDNKIKGILNAAREREVPIYFGFEKFKLGNILRKKHSCVSFACMVNIEGFDFEFKEIVAKIGENRREWYTKHAKEKKENEFLDPKLLEETFEYQNSNQN